MAKGEKAYWVVSPNVKDDNGTMSEWIQASLEQHAAFMGYGPDEPEHANIGPKFSGDASNGIEPGDVILIARRNAGAPEVVGFGIVEGAARTNLPEFTPPDEFGSLRRLEPFVPWSRAPDDVPFAAAVRHTMSLARLHPETDDAHRDICAWMDQHLARRSVVRAPRESDPAVSHNSHDSVRKIDAEPRDISIVASPKNHQLDYTVQTEASVRQAQKLEARLLERYKGWLAMQDRTLECAKYGQLQCDGFERVRNNLIEAKSSADREHVRMAVGQLLDYAFQGKAKMPDPNKAMLLPEKPPPDVEEWLDSIGIKLIWPSAESFLDNANRQFT